MYYCDVCDYTTEYASNFCIHKKSKKHKSLTDKKDKEQLILSKNNNNLASVSSADIIIANKNYNELECPFCKILIKHKSSFSRHKKLCSEKNKENETYNDKLLNKIEILEKEKELERREKELYQKLEKEKSDLLREKSDMLNTFMVNANNLLNKTVDNTKVTAEAMKSVSMSAIKYANEKFKNAPALLPIENFNINNLDFDDEEDKKKLVEILIYNAKQKSLDKLLGDHIVKQYKKEKPEEQMFHTTDCSRLNYIVRQLMEDALIWSVDKSGIEICSSIIKPLIKKCIDTLLEHQKYLLSEMGKGDLNKQTDVELIISILMSIDSGLLESDINKYIAPFFNLNKN